MKNKYKFNTGGISTQKKKNSKQHILNLWRENYRGVLQIWFYPYFGGFVYLILGSENKFKETKRGMPDSQCNSKRISVIKITGDIYLTYISVS